MTERSLCYMLGTPRRSRAGSILISPAVYDAMLEAPKTSSLTFSFEEISEPLTLHGESTPTTAYFLNTKTVRRRQSLLMLQEVAAHNLSFFTGNNSERDSERATVRTRRMSREGGPSAEPNAKQGLQRRPRHVSEGDVLSSASDQRRRRKSDPMIDVSILRGLGLAAPERSDPSTGPGITAHRSGGQSAPPRPGIRRATTDLDVSSYRFERRRRSSEPDLKSTSALPRRVALMTPEQSSVTPGPQRSGRTGTTSPPVDDDGSSHRGSILGVLSGSLLGVLGGRSTPPRSSTPPTVPSGGNSPPPTATPGRGTPPPTRGDQSSPPPKPLSEPAAAKPLSQPPAAKPLSQPQPEAAAPSDALEESEDVLTHETVHLETRNVAQANQVAASEATSSWPLRLTTEPPSGSVSEAVVAQP
jgi:hypothetical protein